MLHRPVETARVKRSLDRGGAHPSRRVRCRCRDVQFEDPSLLRLHDRIDIGCLDLQVLAPQVPIADEICLSSDLNVPALEDHSGSDAIEDEGTAAPSDAQARDISRPFEILYANR